MIGDIGTVFRTIPFQHLGNGGSLIELNVDQPICSNAEVGRLYSQ